MAQQQQQQQQGSDTLKIVNEFNSSPATFNMPMKVKKTMAFQSGDIQDLLTRSRNQNWDPRPDAVSPGPMPDSRLENAKNARLLLDRRPCSTYWLLVGRARGDNVQDEFPHNRNKTFMTLQPRKKSERFSSSHWLTRRGAARGRRGSHFWIMSERQKKRSPPDQPGAPILGDLKGLLLPFSAIVPCWDPSLMMLLMTLGAFIRQEPAKSEAWKSYWR